MSGVAGTEESRKESVSSNMRSGLGVPCDFMYIDSNMRSGLGVPCDFTYIDSKMRSGLRVCCEGCADSKFLGTSQKRDSFVVYSRSGKDGGSYPSQGRKMHSCEGNKCCIKQCMSSHRIPGQLSYPYTYRISTNGV